DPARRRPSTSGEPGARSGWTGTGDARGPPLARGPVTLRGPPAPCPGGPRLREPPQGSAGLGPGAGGPGRGPLLAPETGARTTAGARNYTPCPVYLRLILAIDKPKGRDERATPAPGLIA